MKSVSWAFLLVACIAFPVFADCNSDCAREDSFCIGSCDGDGRCILKCADAHGKCVTGCSAIKQEINCFPKLGGLFSTVSEKQIFQ